MSIIFPGVEHCLKFLFCVCISLCTDGIGLSSSKVNAITLCYTPEIHELLVKIKGGNLKILHCGNHISKLKWDLFSILEWTYPTFCFPTLVYPQPKYFYPGDHVNKPKWIIFFISGMINISYILFFIIDLPINCNGFHEVAASVMRQLLLHTWNSWILMKVKGLTSIFFHHDDYINNWILFCKKYSG